MSEQSNAKSLVRQIGISEPQIAMLKDDRTLFIEGVPKGDKWEWSCDRGACLFTAVTCLRVALENGMGKICVDRGPNHKHYFNTVDILAAHKKKNGGLPHRKMKHGKSMPPMWATLSAKSYKGAFMDTRRLVVPVQERVTSAGAAA